MSDHLPEDAYDIHCVSKLQDRITALESQLAEREEREEWLQKELAGMSDSLTAVCETTRAMEGERNDAHARLAVREAERADLMRMLTEWFEDYDNHKRWRWCAKTVLDHMDRMDRAPGKAVRCVVSWDNMMGNVVAVPDSKVGDVGYFVRRGNDE